MKDERTDLEIMLDKSESISEHIEPAEKRLIEYQYGELRFLRSKDWDNLMWSIKRLNSWLR